jgi:hypothetical protein
MVSSSIANGLPPPESQLHTHATFAYVAATAATMTATMTQFLATTTAITKVPQIQFNNNKPTQIQQKTLSILHPVTMMANNATSRSLFLLCVKDNSKIKALSLLLFDIKGVPAIMTATHANPMLQLIIVSIWWVPKKFIVALHSKGAQSAPSILFDESCKQGLIVDLISIKYSERAQASQTNFNDSKIFLHFRKDCWIFCEEELEQIIKNDTKTTINVDNGIKNKSGLSAILEPINHIHCNIRNPPMDTTKLNC